MISKETRRNWYINSGGKEKKHKYYLENKEKINKYNKERRTKLGKDYLREYNKKYRDAIYKKWRSTYFENKERVIIIMGKKCHDCGIEYNKKNISIFDFHHLENKSHIRFNVLLKKKLETIMEEAEKTILLCSNCHRLRHHGDKHELHGLLSRPRTIILEKI